MISDLLSILEAFEITPLSLLGTRHVSHPLSPEATRQGLERRQAVITKRRGGDSRFRTLRDIFADLIRFVSCE